LRTGGMTTPFAGKAAAELPAGHPPVAKSADEKKSTTPPTTAAKSPSPSSKAPPSAAASQADLPLTFNVPKGWQPTKPVVFALASFQATTEAGPVAISISPFGGPAGGLTMNVNRWLDQVHLPAVGEDELSSLVHPFKVDGLEAKMVRLVG